MSESTTSSTLFRLRRVEFNEQRAREVLKQDPEFVRVTLDRIGIPIPTDLNGQTDDECVRLNLEVLQRHFQPIQD